jgi:hypothetical protein
MAVQPLEQLLLDTPAARKDSAAKAWTEAKLGGAFVGWFWP